ncbi:MAG TPA: 2-C-methyl-D-erythritol 2,4-cyclodiphosphate synthase [Bacteroidota bacterium]
MRFGIGYDVHRFAPKRALILGGVKIPFRLGLLGHSDADVLLHAICDALLGAAALGDIGKHFPDSSRKYKNASSLTLLRQVAAMLRKRKFAVCNIDATLLLQEPKIQGHVRGMQKNIAGALRIPRDRVSVKATTNEGLGFVGRGEGCAALAVASLIPPE